MHGNTPLAAESVEFFSPVIRIYFGILRADHIEFDFDND